MRLESRAFEKRCRELIHGELKSSPEQVRRYKRNRGKTARRIAPWLQRISLTCLILAIFASFLTKRSLDAGLAVFTLWILGSAFRCAQQWFAFFYASTDLAALHLLPVNDEQIFTIQWRKFWRNALWLIPEFLLGYMILCAGRGIPFQWLVLVSLLQAGLVVAMGLHIAAWFSTIHLAFAAGLLKSGALALMVLSAVKETPEWFFRFLFLTSPQGWANYLLKAQAGTFDPTVLLLLIPIAMILYSAIYSLQRLRLGYSLEGIEFDYRFQASPAHPELLEQEDSRRLGPTEIEDTIRDRFFLQSLQWENTGWVERWVSRFLNVREKMVAEFLVAEKPGWTQSFNWSVVIFGIGITTTSVLGHFSGVAIFFPGFLLMVSAIPFFQGGAWRGLALQGLGGSYSGSYSFYPISFDEIARVLLKSNLARSLPGVPLMVAFILFAGWKTGLGFTLSAAIALKILAALLAAMPLGLLFPISSTTNDTSRYPGIFFMVLLGAGALIIPAGLALFLSSSWVFGFVSFLIILATSSAVFALYRRAFKKGKFDLVRTRPD